jgi:hypothetical protein
MYFPSLLVFLSQDYTEKPCLGKNKTKQNIFIYVCVHHMCMGALRGQKRELDLQEQELQVVVSLVVWVLGHNLGFVEELQVILPAEPLPSHVSVPKVFLFILLNLLVFFWSFFFFFFFFHFIALTVLLFVWGVCVCVCVCGVVCVCVCVCVCVHIHFSETDSTQICMYVCMYVYTFT